MKANETNLEPILEGTKQYVVPLFQRSYSWDRREWDPLWDDISEIASDESPRSHFLGSIVTMPAKSVPEGVTKYVLIDGQQRITTILLLLAAIRDVAQSEGGTLAQEIEEQLLTNKFKSGDDAAKLLPTQADKEAFKAALNGQAVLNTNNQIWKAKSFFDRKLRAQDRPSTELLRRAITKHLVIVSIVLDKDDDPHLIFESLNARGLPLSQADLIRNYFLMRFSVGSQEEIHKIYWEPIEDLLKDSTAEFIRHFLARQGSSIKKGDVYLYLKSRTEHLDPQDLEQYLQNLLFHATYYAKFLGLRDEEDAAVSSHLARLRQLDFTVAHPFLLNVFEERDAGRIDREELLTILSTLENFLIRRMVCSVPTYGLNKEFPPLFLQASQYGNLADGRQIGLAYQALSAGRRVRRSTYVRAALCPWRSHSESQVALETTRVIIRS